MPQGVARRTETIPTLPPERRPAPPLPSCVYGTLIERPPFRALNSGRCENTACTDHGLIKPGQLCVRTTDSLYAHPVCVADGYIVARQLSVTETVEWRKRIAAAERAAAQHAEQQHAAGPAQVARVSAPRAGARPAARTAVPA